MKLLFLTTHNLATNPRLYKELTLATSAGHQVELICFEFENWSKSLNAELKRHLKGVKIISIQAGRRPFVHWFYSVATEVLCRSIGKYTSLTLPLLAQAISRRNILLIRALNKVTPPDWVIGHNAGALYATKVAGNKFQCKMGFDVEDYHPGEGNDKHLQQLTRKLMQEVLPSMSYVSFASPLIKKQTEKEVSLLKGHCFTLMNFFPPTEFREPAAVADEPVKLVWFSQNVNYGRGLELVLPFLKTYTGRAELHLFGNMNPEFYHNELKHAANVYVHAPLPQKELHVRLAMFDIGLALEPAKDRNNELAVSNKILAYLQSGLYVIASDTPAQADLLGSFPYHGQCFDVKSNNSATILKQVFANLRSIRSKRQWRYQNFKCYNWEQESQQLLSVWR